MGWWSLLHWCLFNWGLEIKCIGLHGWLAGWRGSIGSRGKGVQLCLLRPLRFGILVETVEHDELVLLPVAGFGGQGSLGRWGPVEVWRMQAFLLLQGLRG